MTQFDRNAPESYAAAFHRVAETFLIGRGFALSSDLRGVGPFSSSGAVYRSARGFWLSIAFDPNDSQTAAITCGREWTPRSGSSFFSGAYPVLTQRFGLQVPRTYSTAEREPLDVFAGRLLADLQRTLPTIIERVSLDDLCAIEREAPSGAAVIAARCYGNDFLSEVGVSDFPAG